MLRFRCGAIHDVAAEATIRQWYDKIGGMDCVHEVSAKILQRKVIVDRQRKQFAALDAKAIIPFLLNPELADGWVDVAERYCRRVE